MVFSLYGGVPLFFWGRPYFQHYHCRRSQPCEGRRVAKPHYICRVSLHKFTDLFSLILASFVSFLPPWYEGAAEDLVLSNPIEKKKLMGLDEEDSCGTALDLGIRIGIDRDCGSASNTRCNGGPPSVQLNLLPLGPLPHDSASSEDFPWARDQGSLGFRRSIDVNELPPLMVSSPHSRFSYFNVDSNGFPQIRSYAVSVKRERVTEESEAEKTASRISDEEESSGTRKKLRLSKDESAVLEESFKENSNLNPRQKQELAKRLNLRPRQVEVWFQNKRARIKLKQTEMDHEFLIRYRDSLTDENRRLQKELQELRALKMAVASELCMQTPVAAVSVCPSCKRVVTADNSRTNTLLPNPHFYSACMHSPVAC